MESTGLDKAKELQDRSKRYALRIIRLFRALPKSVEAQVIGKQLLRSGCSVAANYRAVRRARSRAEFSAKMGTVVEEMDETVFWLELLVESSTMPASKLESMLAEGRQLLAIFAASHSTVRGRRH